MKTLVTTLWLAIVLASALPVLAGPAGRDLTSRPTIAGHHEETPRK